MNSLKSLLLAGFLLAFAASCCRCNEPPDQPAFGIRDLSLWNIDNNGSQPVLSESGSLNRNAFGLAIVFAANNDRSVSLNNAYPLAPYHNDCCTGPRPEWAIEYVRIYTVPDFDEARTAGSEITDYFRILTDGGYLSYIAPDQIREGVFYNSFDSNNNYIIPILLMNPPQGEKEAQFRVVVKFWNYAQEFEKISNLVTLR